MSDTQFPNDDNGDALRHMHEQGVDLTAVHKLDFEFVFPDESSARKFAAAVQGSVLEVSVYVPDGDDEWEVHCTERMVPTHAEITATELRLEAEAARQEGFSDGWGLMSNPDGSPVA